MLLREFLLTIPRSLPPLISRLEQLRHFVEVGRVQHAQLVANLLLLASVSKLVLDACCHVDTLAVPC